MFFHKSVYSLAKDLVPVNRLDVRSIFVSPEPGSKVSSGKVCEIQGLAFDAGDGITSVEVSPDNGLNWHAARLDSVIGKYSWRRWHFNWTPSTPGTYHLLVKATNAKGETQPKHQWNRSGYLRNEIESLELKAE